MAVASFSAGVMLDRALDLPTEARPVAAGEPNPIYDELPDWARAEVDLAPSNICRPDGVAALGNDSAPTTGLWECGGAIMPRRMQIALSEAAERVAR